MLKLIRVGESTIELKQLFQMYVRGVEKKRLVITLHNDEELETPLPNSIDDEGLLTFLAEDLAQYMGDEDQNIWCVDQLVKSYRDTH